MMAGHSHGHGRSRPRVTPRRADCTAGDVERRVRVTCPACGVVRVPLDDVVLRNCLDDLGWSYRARCSRCETLFVSPTPASLAMAAIAAGIRVEQWSLPVPSARHGDGPIGEVDAVELHLALLRPGWVDELAAGGFPDER